jgi:hypothetical protein
MTSTFKWDFDVLTKGTSSFGERETNDSYITVTAGTGEAINPGSFRVIFTNERGSENWCRLINHEYSASGQYLKKVVMHAHARSQGGMGNSGATGRTSGTATIEVGPPPPPE